MVNETEFEKLLFLLNEKEVMLKERELALDEQQEEFLAQKEELTAAVEELIEKNVYLEKTLGQLKQRNNELDQILYRASHDLKTPVSSILGLVGAIKSTGISKEQHVIVNHVFEKTKQMNSLLISLTRLSTAFYQELDFEQCALEALVADAWKRVDEKRGAVLNCKINELVFMTDRTLLSIMLICLFENAAIYSRPGVGNEVIVTGSLSPAGLTLEITDYGEEIPTDLQDKIFQMFFRGSVRSNGSGLGLYISQRIVERLKGTVMLEQRQSKKLFRIILPFPSV